MLRINRAKAVVVLCGLLLAGCEDADDVGPVRAMSGGEGGGGAPPSHEGPGRVHFAAEGFSFVPPPDWTPMPNFGKNFVTYGRAPENGFAVNVNANASPGQGITLEAAPKEIKAAMPKMIPGWRAGEDGFVLINGRRTYTLTSMFQMNQVELKTLQYMLIGDKKMVYTVTFTTPADRYDRHKGEFEACAASILVD